MFDTEQAIAKWRRQMADDGIKAPEILDELESHLREDFERRLRSEANKEHAFRMAVRQMGPARVLKAEFRKIERKERRYMKRVLVIGAGVLGVMVGMALVMPAVAQYRHEGVMRNGEPWLFLIGALLTLAGCGAAFRGMRKSRA
jgi:hypothetical protein